VICLRPRWGSLQRSPRPPIAGFEGLTSKGRGRREEGREKGRGGKRRRETGEGREGKGRKGKGLKPPQSKFSGYVADNGMLNTICSRRGF